MIEPAMGRARRLLGLGCAALLLQLLPGPEAGATDLASARRAVERLRRDGTWRAADVRPVLGPLEDATRRFVAMSRGNAAIRLGDELVPILADLHAGLAAHIEAMRQAVIERDDDVETLLRSAAYRERETLALTALYYLSWARYQQANLLPGSAPGRRELLRKAVRGFTEFVYVNEIPALYGDCLYGRALAFHALGETGNAKADLQAIVELGSRNPAYGRARAALDAIARGRSLGAPTQPVDRTTAGLEQLKKLLASHAAPAGTSGSQRRTAQHEALELARTLAAGGSSNAKRVDAVIEQAGGKQSGAFLDFLRGELASDRGEHERAIALYVRAAEATDADAEHYRSRARFAAAAARYRAARYDEAAAAFAAFAAGHPDAAEAEAALYFRFKALEAQRAATPAAGGADASYLVALGEYLERFPSGPNAPEIRYRLAEGRHASGDCDGALRAAGEPAGAGAWEQWARFIVVQCRAAAARAGWHAGADAEGDYTAARDAARAIRDAAIASEDAAILDLGARASLLAALLAASAPTPRPADTMDFVTDFERQFPDAGDLLGDAIALRIVARARLGSADARAGGTDIAALADMAALDDPEAGADSLRGVGTALVAEADRTTGERRRAFLALAQSVYQALASQPAARTGNGGRPAGTVRTADLAILGQIGLELGDPGAAAAAYEALLAADPGSLEALRGIALTTEQQGENAEALRRWQAVMARANPGDTLWYEGVLHTARIEHARGRTAAACAVLRNARAQVTATPVPEEHTRLEQQYCR
jgi:tetratricopeptide (TPR) repeat protein